MFDEDSQNNDDLVVVANIQKYDELVSPDDSSVLSILVGPKGLKMPRHRDSMVLIPTGLINHTKEKPNGTIEIEIPRWLAEQKELPYVS